VMILERLVLEKEEEFSRMVTSHRGALLRFGLRRLRTSEQAEDLAAEAFAVAWRRFDDAPPVEQQLIWLYRIESLLLSNVYRSQRRLRSLEGRLAGLAIESDDEFLAGVDGKRMLLLAIGRLSQTEQEVLRLRYWEELSYREIGVVLDCSETAAGIRLSRARRRLKMRFIQISKFGTENIEKGHRSER
jgi:RNA polymerase sigma factor (sigma-70 family)